MREKWAAADKYTAILAAELEHGEAMGAQLGGFKPVLRALLTCGTEPPDREAGFGQRGPYLYR